MESRCLFVSRNTFLFKALISNSCKNNRRLHCACTLVHHPFDSAHRLLLQALQGPLLLGIDLYIMVSEYSRRWIPLQIRRPIDQLDPKHHTCRSWMGWNGHWILHRPLVSTEHHSRGSSHNLRCLGNDSDKWLHLAHCSFRASVWFGWLKGRDSRRLASDRESHGTDSNHYVHYTGNHHLRIIYSRHLPNSTQPEFQTK